ncbi:MAG: hypothetical protein U9R20_02080 [Thermodesulfobacteriota bacterium]|nr:hypothetical protein [Thermodesulfobacteriota bacterium]
MKRKIRKKPCRICGKWFSPNPRVGDRQMTCGAKDCQRKWHTKKCSEWNKTHPEYFQEIYLTKKLADDPDNSKIEAHSAGSPVKSSKLPRKVIQEVIGTQHLIIIEYINRLLLKSFQEVISRQLLEIITKQDRLPGGTSSRGDSQRRGS